MSFQSLSGRRRKWCLKNRLEQRPDICSFESARRLLFETRQVRNNPQIRKFALLPFQLDDYLKEMIIH